jgi:hypothetical protein
VQQAEGAAKACVPRTNALFGSFSRKPRGNSLRGGLGDRFAELQVAASGYWPTAEQQQEATMPLIPVILWVGVPVLLIGGGYYVLVHMAQ